MPEWIEQARAVVEELWEEYKPDEQSDGQVNEVRLTCIFV